MFQVSNKTTQKNHVALFKVQNRDSSTISNLVGLLLTINFYQLQTVF